ncbi:hypothetical protein KI387_033673, partial [Taxus chinensis]
FVSLDCGGEEEYNDTQTGLHWTSDQQYTKAGEIKSISPTELKGEIFERPLRQLRCFPQGKRNCYTLPAMEGSKYLIRASFLYGNYDGRQLPPQFELLIDANPWDSVVINRASDIISKEAIAMARSASISVCVARSGDDTPFISALELRPMTPSMYPTVALNYSLFLLSRTDDGSLSNSPTRYPDDEFDRIWQSETSETSDSVLYINTTDNISAGPRLEIPSAVHRTALVSDSITWSRDFEQTGDYFIVLAFAEIEKQNINEVREFKFSIDDEWKYTVQLTEYLQHLDRYMSFEVTNAGTTNFSLDPTSESTVGAIVNGREMYQYSGLLINGTHSEDAEALADIALQLNLDSEWTGDPCLPQKYSWKWVTCTQDSSPRIISVNLSGKRLNGTIPTSFGNLSSLAKLNLANNFLTGPIPVILSNLSQLEELNLAENNLNGSVPTVLVDKERNGRLFLSIEGNEILCQTGTCQNTQKRHPSKALLVSLIIVAVATLVTVTAVIIFIKYKSRSTISKGKPEANYLNLVKFDGCRSFSYEEVKAMTGNFEREIGKGGYGPVFYGCLQDKEVAIKILSDKSHQGITEFSTEVDVLSKLHHKNLVKFVGYCTERQNLVLIYDYMCNGDLRQRLDGQDSSLDWEKRLKIALDAAQGLEYLHLGCKPGIIHRDVKSSNILLNERMDAKIADFGLSKMGPLEGATHITTLVKGTTGYLDPEYYTAHRLTEKSDVYSFGVVLMEIICGRRPHFFDSSTQQQIHITSWVRPALLKGNIESIADPILLNKFNADSMWKVAELSMVCTSPYSMNRPAMNEVVLELKEATRFQTRYYPNMNLHELGSPDPLLHHSQGSSSVLDWERSLYPVAR